MTYVEGEHVRLRISRETEIVLRNLVYFIDYDKLGRLDVDGNYVGWGDSGGVLADLAREGFTPYTRGSSWFNTHTGEPEL